jgi:hypothetical protein
VSRRVLVPVAIRRFIRFSGAMLCVAGAVGRAAALTQADAIRQQLPDVAVDAAAVGGAAAALSSAVLALGVVHLLLAGALRRGVAWSVTAGIVVGHIVGGLVLALAAAAWVLFADGAGAVALIGGIGLVLAAAAYGVVVVWLIGLKRRSEGSAHS